MMDDGLLPFDVMLVVYSAVIVGTGYYMYSILYNK